jgi:hypothetical protein
MIDTHELTDYELAVRLDAIESKLNKILIMLRQDTEIDLEQSAQFSIGGQYIEHGIRNHNYESIASH